MIDNLYVNVFVRRYLYKKIYNSVSKEGNSLFFYVINTYMDDKKATKLIIKRAKKNPVLYTKEDILYAKKIKNQLKKNAVSHQEN